MNKHRIRLAKDSAEDIAAAVDEYLDWKEVYASQIEDGMKGAVTFAANEHGDVFIQRLFVTEGVNVGEKTICDDGDAKGLTAKVVWVDGAPIPSPKCLEK